MDAASWRSTIRILAVTDSHPPYHAGGYEIRCKSILDKLQARGHSVHIVTTRPPRNSWSPKDEENISRVLHQEFRSRGLLRGILDDYRDITAVDKSIRSFEPDIVYLGHIINLTRAIFPYLAETDIPVVIDDGGISASWSFSHRGPWYGLIGRRSNSTIKNWMKCLLRTAANKLSHNRLKKTWSWPANISAFFNKKAALEATLDAGVILQDARVIYSGIDVNQFVFVERELKFECVQIVAPGRIEPKKGTKDSILLLKHLRGKNVRAELTIVGGLSSTTYYSELLELMKKLGIQQSITFVPQVDYDQMPRYYRQADICFFPSHHSTGLSRVPLEAMASGCLVITYGKEGSSEVIRHGDTGYIVPEGAIEAAAELICELIATPMSLRNVILNARHAVEQLHSMDSYVDEIEKFLLKAESSRSVPSNQERATCARCK